MQPVVTAVPSRRHFPLLDGYRALAALLVVLCHAALISGLNGRLASSLGPYLARADVGVAIFFVLSGFLIYRPFVTARLADRPGMGTVEFYRRRVLRIFPAYWVTLLVVGYVMKAPGFEPPHNVFAHLFLVHIYDIDQVIGGPVQQSWSLATEISFYLVVPLYAALVGIRRSRRDDRGQFRWELTGVTALVVFGVGIKLVALAAGVSDPRFGQLGTTLPFRIDAFALGMGLAVISAWQDHTGSDGPAWFDSRWFAPSCYAAALVTFWAVSTRFDLSLGPIFSGTDAFIVNQLYALTAFFALLPGFFGPPRRGVVRRVFAHPVAVWIGLISYGIYIWHEAWLEVWFRVTDHRYLAAPFWQVLIWNLVLTIPVAALSYYVIERPLLRLKKARG